MKMWASPGDSVTAHGLPFHKASPLATDRDFSKQAAFSIFGINKGLTATIHYQSFMNKSAHGQLLFY